MNKERALKRLRGLWWKSQVYHLAVIEDVDMRESAQLALGDYFGYKRALLDVGLITCSEVDVVENDKLILEEKAA